MLLSLKQYEELSSASVGKPGLAAKTADRLLYELLQSCVKGTLRTSQVLSAIKELLVSGPIIADYRYRTYIHLSFYLINNVRLPLDA